MGVIIFFFILSCVVIAIGRIFYWGFSKKNFQRLTNKVYDEVTEDLQAIGSILFLIGYMSLIASVLAYIIFYKIF